MTATIWTYWLGVGIMIFRVQRKTHRLGGLVPEQAVELRMWIVWVPLVAAWLALPYLALVRRSQWLHTPVMVLTDPAYAGLRWVAALIAVVCLCLTAWCWARMDTDWSIAVIEGQRGEFIADGLFARVRHPIYALSVMLMICSAVIVATLPMLAIAVVHIVLMHFKARNEERHLLKMHGDAYAAYLRRTGRFVPRLGAHAA